MATKQCCSMGSLLVGAAVGVGGTLLVSWLLSDGQSEKKAAIAQQRIDAAQAYAQRQLAENPPPTTPRGRGGRVGASGLVHVGATARDVRDARRAAAIEKAEAAAEAAVARQEAGKARQEIQRARQAFARARQEKGDVARTKASADRVSYEADVAEAENEVDEIRRSGMSDAELISADFGEEAPAPAGLVPVGFIEFDEDGDVSFYI